MVYKVKNNNILVFQWVTTLTLYKEDFNINQVPTLCGLRSVVQEVLDEAEAEQEAEVE